MNITYLIGNGFDIGLGLRTGYRSFFDRYVEQSNESPAGVGRRFGSAAQRGCAATVWMQRRQREWTRGISQVDLFRIQEGREEPFLSLLAAKYQTVTSSSAHGFDFKLVYQPPEDTQEVNWGWAFALFDKPIRALTDMTNGVFLLSGRCLNGGMLGLLRCRSRYHA